MNCFIFKCVFASVCPGTLVRGQATLRRVKFQIDFSAPVLVYYLANPDVGVVDTITGEYIGDRGFEAKIVATEGECPEGPAPPPTTVPTPTPPTSPTPAPPPPPPPPLFCFSEHSMVQVKDQGPIPLLQLKIGDAVEVADGKFSKVYSFAHFAPEASTPFLQILGENMEEPLEITSEHMLYVNGTTKIPARDINVGDYLSSAIGLTQVISLGTVTRAGAYAPLTITGNIVVNGVHASTYVAHQALTPFLSYDMQHFVQHSVFLPYRVYCGFIGCENESYDETTGLSRFAAAWIPMLNWLEHGQQWLTLVQLFMVFLGYAVWKLQLANESGTKGKIKVLET